MTQRVLDPGQAVAARSAAVRRVRRLTGVAIGVAAALAGVFTALAAGSTHHRRATVLDPKTSTSRKLAAVVAPAPPLVGLRDAAPPPPASSAPAPAPAPAPAAPPVVVSGGS